MVDEVIKATVNDTSKGRVIKESETIMTKTKKHDNDSKMMVIPDKELPYGVSRELYELVRECIDNFDTIGNNEYPFVGGVLYMVGQIREEIRSKLFKLKKKYNFK